MSTGYADSLPQPAQPTSSLSPGAKLAYHLNANAQPMDGRQSEYPQSGLSSPYPTFPGPQSQGSPADQASAAQYPHGQDPRSANFSSSATPTSEYGIPPASARSGSFPEYVNRGYHTPSGQGANAGGMAQATSPSMPLPDGQASNHNAHNIKSDPDVPIDPSIAATSPTYPPQPQYSPYQPQHDMTHYQGHPGVYGAPPDWARPGQYPPPHMAYGHPPATSGPPSAPLVSPVQRPPTVRALFFWWNLNGCSDVSTGRSPSFDRLFICSDPRRTAAQAP